LDQFNQAIKNMGVYWVLTNQPAPGGAAKAKGASDEP